MSSAAAADSLNPTTGTVLGFLEDCGPLTGWQLWTQIEVSVGNFWNVTRSQVYRELPRLADRGLVTVGPTGPRDQRPYRITAAGRRAFRRWLAAGPPPELRRIPILLVTFFGAHLDPDELAAALETADAEAARTLDSYAELDSAVADPFHQATLRFGQAYARLVRTWIADEAMPLLEQDR